MSLAAVKSFHLKLQQDVGLQDEILEMTNGSMDGWQPWAVKLGFSVTQEDINEYLDSLHDLEYELSDFELELVSAASKAVSDNPMQ